MATIAELLAAGRTFSFEFMPPKDQTEQERLVRTLRDLEPLAPHFVSVTYRGGRASRQRTHDLVVGMLKTTTLTPMAHLTTAVHSRLELAEIVCEYRRAGVENLLALGGDPPEGDEGSYAELAHASELVALARAIGMTSIGVAAHPEGHVASMGDLAADRRHTAAKLALADFAITQFFYEIDDYLRLVEDLSALGADKPVLPGIMPITNLRQVQRFAQLSGAAVPAWIVTLLEGAATPEDVRRVGIDLATQLCADLLDQGVPGLHFYTLNTSTATREIHAALGLAPATAAA